MGKFRVYYVKNVTVENLVKLYKKLGIILAPKIAVKLHSGERGNRNYLKPEFFRPIIDYVNGIVVDMFKGNIAFINVMANMSVDCDCCAVAENPCLKDMGILASTDPVSIDQACVDLVYNSNDPGKEHFVEKVKSRNGTRTIDTAYRLGIATKSTN